MSTRNTLIIILILTAALLAAGTFMRPAMGDQIATHWNAQGQVDGYGSVFVGIYLLPLTILGISLLVLAIPAIDPLRANIEAFRADLNGFVVAMGLFLAYLHVLTLIWNTGTTFNFNQAITPAFGFLLYFVGVMVGKARRNFFIGIRTPWTLSSDLVWERTHQLGGKLFKLAGLVSLPGIFFPNLAIWLVLGPLLLVTVFVTVYSYLEYRKIAQQG